jgi:DNA mismatch repair ATPase MutL
MSNLAKPYAVIRRALATQEGIEGEVEGDAEDEDDLEDEQPKKKITPARIGYTKGKGKGRGDDSEDDEAPLFPPNPEDEFDPFHTPPKSRNGGHASSSPSTIYPSSAMKDYSSELDFSSPPMSDTSKRDREEEDDGDEDEEDEEEERRRRKKAKKASMTKQRTRRYEVVGIVRKKVVFALRQVQFCSIIGGTS